MRHRRGRRHGGDRATADPAVTGRQAMYRVDVPGGMLAVTWTAEGHVYLTGPAVVVARGTTDL